MNNACLTQLAEYRSCKPKVIGSTPIAGYPIIFQSVFSNRAKSSPAHVDCGFFICMNFDQLHKADRND